MQYTSVKVPAKAETAKGPESPKHAAGDSAQKSASGAQKQDQRSVTGTTQSSTTPAAKESGGLFGFGSSIFTSASSLMGPAVQQEPKITPPVSPKMQPAKETKPPPGQKSVQEKKHEPPHQTRVQLGGQAKEEKTPSQISKTSTASSHAPKTGQSACPLCNMVLNVGLEQPPNYNTCTDCKTTVCNQCGFNPMPNVKEVRNSVTHI